MIIKSINKPIVENISNYNTIVYSNATGDLPKNIKHFQDWMDKVHPNWLNDGTNLNKNVSKGYGNGGAQTKKAYATYGTAYESALQSVLGILSGTSTGSSSPSSTTTQSAPSSPQLPPSVSETNPKGEKKKGMLWDKTKGTWVKGSDWLKAHPEFANKMKGFFGNIFSGDNPLAGLFGGSKTSSKDTVSYEDNSYNPEPTDKTMSKNAKIGLAIGGGILLLVIGIVIYKSVQTKSSTK